jgi:type I restriction enzyme R subunit
MLEKLFIFSRLLSRKLPVPRGELPLEIQQNINMDSYRVQKTHNGKIKLERGTNEIEPIGAKGGYAPSPEEIEQLSLIIQELNQRFGTDFTDEDKVFIKQLEEKLAVDSALKASVHVNV